MTELSLPATASRPYLIRLLLARPRLLVSVVMGLLTGVLLPEGTPIRP